MFIMKKFGNYLQEIRLQSLLLTLIKTKTEFLKVVTTI